MTPASPGNQLQAIRSFAVAVEDEGSGRDLLMNRAYNYNDIFEYLFASDQLSRALPGQRHVLVKMLFSLLLERSAAGLLLGGRVRRSIASVTGNTGRRNCQWHNRQGRTFGIHGGGDGGQRHDEVFG